MLVGLTSLLIFELLREAQWGLLLTFLLTLVSPAYSCRFCWYLIVPARLCHCCCYPDTPKLDCWNKCLWVDRATAADLCTELLLSWQHWRELLQRTISKHIHFPCILAFPPPLVSGGLEGKLKHLRTITKSYRVSLCNKPWLSCTHFVDQAGLNFYT